MALKPIDRSIAACKSCRWFECSEDTFVTPFLCVSYCHWWDCKCNECNICDTYEDKRSVTVYDSNGAVIV